MVYSESRCGNRFRVRLKFLKQSPVLLNDKRFHYRDSHCVEIVGFQQTIRVQCGIAFQRSLLLMLLLLLLLLLSHGSSTLTIR